MAMSASQTVYIFKEHNYPIQPAAKFAGFTIKPKRKIRIIKDNWKVGRVDEGKNPNPAARRCSYIYHTPQVRILHLPHIFKTPKTERRD